MSEWQTANAHLLGGLTAAQRARVLSSLNNSALEGFEPTAEDVAVMVRLELGQVTSLEAMADVASRRGPRGRDIDAP